MTALMTDILRQFETLQKEAQRSLITFPDLLVKNEQVLAHLDVMKTKPFPGGKEEDLKVSAQPELLVVVDKRKTPHKLVTKPDRAFETIRRELILTGYNFLHVPLHEEQDESVQNILEIANATNANELISAGV